jgi:hypothetical protein
VTLEPDVLKDGLSVLAAEADEVRIETAEIGRRARSRRRARLAGSGSACAVAVVAVTLLWPGGSSGERARVLAGPGAQDRSASYHGVELSVPSSWAVNADRCGTPTRDTVLYPHTTTMCAWNAPKAYDTVQFGPASQVSAPGRGLSFHGHPAVTAEKRLADGRTQETLVVPDLDVAVVATTHDAALARRIVTGAKLARPVDSVGCADPVVNRGPAITGRAATTMVPSGFSTAIICVYEDLRLSRSAVVSRTDTQRLASMLDGLRPGLQSQSSIAGQPKQTRGQLCKVPSGGYSIRFSYPSGDPLTVVVRTGGCEDIGATNGKVTGHLTQPLLDKLGKISGAYLTGTPLNDLVPR